MAEGSKTEKATPKKRRDERKKGHVFMSQDAVSVVTLVGAFAMLVALSGIMVEQMGSFITYCVAACAGSLGQVNALLPELGRQAMAVLAKTGLPLCLVTALCAIIGTFAQTRMLVSGELMKPKFSRLNPLEGFKRLFSLKSVIEALKGILKITILLIIIYLSLADSFRESAKYLYTDLGTAGRHLFEICKDMVVRIIIAFIALAAMDFLYQWWDYERQMRMSKQEIKEEYKQMEGDPQVKGKIKQIQRERAQRRMMQQVPSADVVIRNPTHFAVALGYKPERDSAPIVLAKGQDEMAARIVKKAEECGISIVENVPLARALYAQADLDREIPPELYEPVAEVLVYIFHINDKKQIVRQDRK